MNKPCIFFLILACIVVFLSGCTAFPIIQHDTTRLTNTPDTSTQEAAPIPTITSTSPVEVRESVTPSLVENGAPLIQPENAGQLSLVATINVDNTGNIFWQSDSQYLLVISQKTLYKIDASNFEITRKYSLDEENAWILDVSPDGHTIAVTSDQINVELFDIDLHQNTFTLNFPDMFLDATFSSDGKILGVAGADEIKASLWDTKTGKHIKTLSGFETAAPVYGFTFSPDNKTLLWVSRSKVQLMDIQSNTLGSTFFHEDFINHAAISPDGNMLACSTAATVEDIYTPVIQLWNTKNAEEINQLVTISIASLSFSPDGKLIAAGNGPYLFIWKSDTQEELAILDGVSPGIIAVAFSPDGRTLASSSQDQTIRLWRAAP